MSLQEKPYEESRDRFGLLTRRYYFASLECGHFIRLDAPRGLPCPHCEEYAEAHGQDFEDSVFDCD